MVYYFGEYADWLILISIAIGLLFYFSTSTFDYWKKKGIRYKEPIPLFGNSMKTSLSLVHTANDQQALYNHFKGERVYGKFVFRSPVLVIRDPELVETVLIRDFTHFYNRGIKVNVKLDRLSQHLVNLENQQWKSLRNKLTPVFTSGKLKTMHQTLIHCSESLVEILDSFAVAKKPFEAREVMANFTTEVIGHCAFGIEMNTLKNPNSEFRAMGREFFKPTFMRKVRLLIRQTYPSLLNWLQWKQIPVNVEQFFINVIKETMDVRNANNLEVHDFLQLLIQLRKQDQPQLDKREKGELDQSNNDELLMDDTLMTSNAMVFFLAGFETTAATLSSCLLELAQNPDIQDKLRENIKNVISEYNGIPVFEAIKKLPYLDHVITETLRKLPPVVSIPRQCSKDWRIPDTDIVIPKGSMIQIPIYSIHHDPEYYPQPDKFLPERFAEENKHNLKKGTYLPFGDGPRICIGSRFARQEMKVALATMILNCRFTLNSKTIIPLEFNPKAIFLIPKGGVWLNVEKIK